MSDNDFNFDDIDLGEDVNLTEQLKGDIVAVDHKETFSPGDVAIVEESDLVLVGSSNRPGPLTPSEDVPRKITKEDNDNYDRKLAEFKAQKAEELKDKIFSGTVKDKSEVLAAKASGEPVDSDKGKTSNKKTKAEKIQKLKEEIAPVVEAHTGEVDAMREEAIKNEKEAEKLNNSNVVVVDAQSVDDRKKLEDYYNEGRMVVDPKGKAFILAEQIYPTYNPCKPPIHKVYLHEIVHVTVRNYYLDLVSMPKGNRILAKKVIWCYHKGYSTFTMITERQLIALLDDKTITPKQVLYVHNDMSTGQSYFLGTDSNEPDSKKIEMLEKMELGTHIATNNPTFSSKDIVEDSIESIDEEVIVNEEENIVAQGA